MKLIYGSDQREKLGELRRRGQYIDEIEILSPQVVNDEGSKIFESNFSSLRRRLKISIFFIFSLKITWEKALGSTPSFRRR